MSSYCPSVGFCTSSLAGSVYFSPVQSPSAAYYSSSLSSSSLSLFSCCGSETVVSAYLKAYDQGDSVSGSNNTRDIGADWFLSIISIQLRRFIISRWLVLCSTAAMLLVVIVLNGRRYMNRDYLFIFYNAS